MMACGPRMFLEHRLLAAASYGEARPLAKKAFTREDSEGAESQYSVFSVVKHLWDQPAARPQVFCYNGGGVEGL